MIAVVDSLEGGRGNIGNRNYFPTPFDCSPLGQVPFCPHRILFSLEIETTMTRENRDDPSDVLHEGAHPSPPSSQESEQSLSYPLWFCRGSRYRRLSRYQALSLGMEGVYNGIHRGSSLGCERAFSGVGSTRRSPSISGGVAPSLLETCEESRAGEAFTAGTYIRVSPQRLSSTVG